ncbi:MAG: FecR domain-containing protein [Bacteroidales bacterium]|nr:FecR domain-containing protein [Bacteroidales bacterium]
MEAIYNNEEIFNLIAKYLNNEMENSERIAFENEINMDKTLKNMVEELKPGWESLEALTDAADVNVDKAWDNLYGRIEQSRPAKVLSLRPLLRLAAGFLILLGLAAGFYTIRNYRNASIVVSSGDQTMEITLPDGSNVMLNVNSKVEYPKISKGDERKISLIGEAYFDVISNPDCPFIIEANDASVMVLGTAFNVYAREDGHTEVFLERGKVQLSQNKNNTNSLVLEPGYIGKLESGAMSTFRNDDVNYMSWKSQVIEFREDSLAYVFPTLSHAYNTKFIIKNAEINNLRYTGTITRQSLENVLKALETNFNLEFTYTNGAYTVTIR